MDTASHAQNVNERHEALMNKMRSECVLQGFPTGSHEYYAALCGKMSVHLLVEMGSHDFWKAAHEEAIKVCSY